jgi:MFS transporter, ACS family, tartrate transporter
LIAAVLGVQLPLALANPAVTVPRKIARRLLPFLLLIYMTAFIDRVNVGFAGLDMTRELHFSNEVFGFGAGIFFFGLCLLEIPGAMFAHSRSARTFIAAIMIAWGVLASLTGLVQTATQFNVIRFLLGAAEGGFFPAVMVYMTHWFRQEDRAKAVALFMTAVPVSSATGGVIAGWLLSVHWLGLSGWRWLLVLEGIPAVIFGIATVFYLTDRPKDAHWLSEDEKAWIQGELERETKEKETSHLEVSILQSFASGTVVILVAGYFFINLTGYGLNIWLPKIVQKLPGLTIWQVGLVASLPHVFAIPAMNLAGWNADRTGLHKRHAAIAACVAAAGLAMSQLPGISGTVSVTGFCIAMMGIMSYYPCYWALPTKLLNARIAAAVCGLITMANIGGFVGPYAIGFLTDLTGTQVAGMLVLVLSAVLAGGSVALLRTR